MSASTRRVDPRAAHDRMPPLAQAGDPLSAKTRDDAGDLAVLLEVGEALAREQELRERLEQVLEKLEDAGAVRAAMMMLSEETGDIHVEVSLGFDAEGRRVRYQLGEGITGQVVQSGRAMVVPAVTRESLFLHRAMDRRGGETSFVCVPILLDRKPVGALSVDLPYDAQRDYDGARRFFAVVASMIAQALKVHRAIEEERRSLLDENSHLRSELQQRYDLGNIVGTSGPMRQACEQIARIAPADTTALIRGESGTGKELFARAIHYNSPRAKKPFIKVSAAALPDTLIESELFGHEKGAFTDALARRCGRFELAQGGTLFLDEVGELTPAAQVKLLRVLQERDFERVGGTETVKVDVRLIAATNKDLEAAIVAREFREDLYYRLNVFSIFVPPLRDRRPDIMLLADHFLGKYCRQHGKSIRRISTTAIDMLMAYHWPGNVRELENTIERAVLTCDGNVIHGHHLPPTLQTAEASGTVTNTSLSDAVEQYEKDLILDALKSSRGNRARAARLLNSTERIVGYKIRKYRIDPRRFRAAALDEASILRSFGSKTYQEFLPLFEQVEFKFVFTATPSPNRYKELIHYAGFLGVMDTGQALTRFFQRDSEKAGNL
ncbi:MAG TPA: sigma 54-interacting transcriptional regulator, partial [Myxococcales bacterium]